MKKTLIALSILVLIVLVTLFLITPQITGYSVSSSEYSYTRAICNESNYCQDYEINCNYEKTIQLKPITGASIQHSIDWKDPREKIEIEDLCKTSLNS